jgi:hypothetical protein
VARSSGQEPAREPRIVPFIRLRCSACRRARGAYLTRATRGAAGIPAIGDFVPVCPHHRTIWAPGMGPGSEPPPPGSGWQDRTPPV